jgi:hypothetical protein
MYNEAKVAPTPKRKEVMADSVTVKMSLEMRQIVNSMADEAGVPVGEMCLRLMARALKRPELGVVPRKQMGRPRKELATA